ncbi:hypothetical protein B0T24DRAFT_521417 [Lasiosphaeria ovina]|uniref:Uncharacterized protein n=1 Tax=Lasiosphaeria ovina TaxID=92902 RepID=A0AAE0TT85_9PEZI|nr:hypothetical protein B0T24DRAFT_521417 [Lasiosphaeria ovina]
MELQTQSAPPTSQTNEATGAAPPSPQTPTSTSVPALRFPKPQGNKYLANWVSNSSPDIKQPPNMSDTGNLADSAYEIINGTDSESQSQDGRLTESTGSLEVSRPEDVQSLDGSETHYDTDSDTDEDSDHSSHASSIRYADQSLENPSTQLPANSLRFASPSASEQLPHVSHSIEFQEGDEDRLAAMDKISVKHTTHEFTAEKSATIAEQLGMQEAPRRLVATIRQTMSQAYLSTNDPLRVLYVGRAEAQRGIVLKVSSAIWASPKNDAKDEDHFSRHREGVYNIVPISSFGPTPELDLMEASHYQIKVEHCTSASVLEYPKPSSPERSVYSITVEHDNTYYSHNSRNGPVVQPRWALPHIAIFYCSDDADEQEEKTRDAVWMFLRRHNIPSIFITESEAFGKLASPRWDELVDEHAVHLCLESRDPERPITPRRLPIDFPSFLNIDARQMNRNFSYLTGLSDSAERVTALKVEAEPSKSAPGMKKYNRWTSRPSGAQILESMGRNKLFFALAIPMLMAFIMPLFAGLFSNSLSLGTSSPISTSLASGILDTPQATPPARLTTTTRAATTSTTTVVINVTSTKTIQLSHVRPSASTLASALSFAGFLSDKPSEKPSGPAVEPEEKKTVCSVRISGQNEILVTIPSGNKAGWLAKGAIDIDVFRGDKPVKTKLSSVDEGIVAELKPADAYGVLNVSVITTRKPKINETFGVDFGKPVVAEVIEASLHILQDLAKMVSATADETVHLVEEMYVPAAAGLAKLRGDTTSALKHGVKAAQSHYSETVSRYIKHTKEHISRQLKSVDKIRENSILQAQIASKLWWLKVQGKTDEYAEYQRSASHFLEMKHAELVQTQRGPKKEAPKESWALFGKRQGRQCKKDAKARQGTKDSRWKKMVKG